MCDIDVELVKKVGDFEVWKAMEASDIVIGGEQSGHVIYRDIAQTGDGLITFLLLLKAIIAAGRDFEKVDRIMTVYPQILINVKVKDKSLYDSNVNIKKAVEQAKLELDGSGRILVRASGTEPLIRVMVEAPYMDDAKKCAQKVADVIEEEIGV
ncbi:MAG: phosphoglucosamine mutase, partial [Coriobacteriales bacterium]|nr:phosphoglucosamine mutase [Coriobacteriales bacterium]